MKHKIIAQTELAKDEQIRYLLQKTASQATEINKLKANISDLHNHNIETEQFYKDMLGNVPGVVYKGYSDWSIEGNAEGLLAITGYTLEELNSLPNKVLDIVLEEDRAFAREVFISALKRKAAIAELQLSETEHQDFQKIAETYIGIIDKDNVITINYTNFNIIKEQLRLIKYPEYENIISVLRDALTEKKTFIREFRIKTKQNKIVWLQERAMLRILPNGKVVTNGFFYDLSERMATRKILQATLEELDLIFNQQDVGIAIYASNSANDVEQRTIIKANLAFRQIFEFPDKEIKELKPCVFWSNESKHLLFHKMIEETGIVNNFEAEITTSTGKQKTVYVSANLLSDGKVLTTFTDITLLNSLKANEQKIANAESLKILAGGICHDLNNALQVIMGNLDFAMFKIDSLQPESIAQSIAKAIEGVKSTQELTEMFWDINYPNRNNHPNVFQWITLMPDIRSIIGTEKLKITNELPDSSIYIKVDKQILKKVFEALIINAKAANAYVSPTSIAQMEGITDIQAIAIQKQLKYSPGQLLDTDNLLDKTKDLSEELIASRLTADLQPFAQKLTSVLQTIKNKLLDLTISKIVLSAENITRKNITQLIGNIIVPENMNTGEYIVFSIRDYGMGITPSNIEKVFEPYVTTSNIKNVKGKGFGLTLARAYTQASGGFIVYKSEPRRGSTFNLFIPINKEED